MKFFLDENFPKSAEVLLSSAGHQVIDIRGTKHSGCDDDKIFRMALDEDAIFLTTDKDFFHTIPYLYESHHGVIVIALKQPNRKNISEKLKWLLDNFDFSTIKSKVLLLKDKTYSISPK